MRYEREFTSAVSDTDLENKEPQNPRSRGWIKHVATGLVASLLSLSFAYFTGAWEQYVPPTAAEQRAEQGRNLLALMQDNKFASEVFNSLPEDVQKKQLINLLSDGELDSSLLLTELREVDLSFVGEFVRPVSITSELRLTEEEVIAVLNQSDETITTFDDLPQNVKDGFNEEGIFVISVADLQVNGFLSEDVATVPSAALSNTLVFADKYNRQDNISVEVKLLSDTDTAAYQKEEVLFSGLVSDLLNSPDVEIDAEHAVAFFARTSQTILFTPTPVNGSYYDTIAIGDLRTSKIVVYGDSENQTTTTISSIVASRDSFVLKGNFTADDYGKPVFVFKDGKPMWAGVIVSLQGFSTLDTAVVVSAQVVKDGMAATS